MVRAKDNQIFMYNTDNGKTHISSMQRVETSG